MTKSIGLVDELRNEVRVGIPAIAEVVVLSRNGAITLKDTVVIEAVTQTVPVTNREFELRKISHANKTNGSQDTSKIRAEIETVESTDQKLGWVNNAAARNVAVVSERVEARTRSTFGSSRTRLPRVISVFGRWKHSAITSHAEGVVDLLRCDVGNLHAEQRPSIGDFDLHVELRNGGADDVEQVMKLAGVGC